MGTETVATERSGRGAKLSFGKNGRGQEAGGEENQETSRTAPGVVELKHRGPCFDAITERRKTVFPYHERRN